MAKLRLRNNCLFFISYYGSSIRSVYRVQCFRLNKVNTSTSIETMLLNAFVQGNISNEVYIDLKHVLTVYYILYVVHIFSS